MKLSPIAVAVTVAIVWGAAIFLIGGINAFVPGYGDAVLTLVVSIYPGYEASGSFGDLLQGTAYGFFDGLAGGFVFALLYNAVVRLSALVTGEPMPATEPALAAEPASATEPTSAPQPTPAAEPSSGVDGN